MCNIWQEKETKELTLNQIRELLDDPIFKTIEHVIFSGGEPTLREDIGSIAKHFVEKCSSLQKISIPTNGLIPELAVKTFHSINEACKNSKVKFAFSVSLDGIQGIHGKVRGIPNAFEKTAKTIHELKRLQTKFDFELNAHCVVTNLNVNSLPELIRWCNQQEIPFSFELAHNWKRFTNENNQFQLTNNQKSVFLNALWKQIKQPKGTEYDWMTYRMIKSGKKRYYTCPFLVDALSIHPDGNVYYCPGSEPIGNILEDKLSNIYYNKKNSKLRTIIKRNECPSCTQSLWWYARNKELLLNLRYNAVKKIITATG